MKRVLLFAVLVTSIPATALAQQAFRPGGIYDDPVEKPRDVSGYSVRGPRIRVVHTTDPALEGGSMYLQQVDPWLGYLMGRELLQREWKAEEGVFGETAKPDGLLLPDGATHEMSRDHVNSCSLCHNTPYRDAGAGLTMPKNGGTGRNSPHFFGGGLLEMLGAEIRLAALNQADDNRDGWINLVEAKDKRFVYQTMPEASGEGVALDFGRFDDHNLDGRPDLNPLLHVVYCDGQGKRIAWAERLTDAGVKGYRIEVQVYGHSRLRVSSRPPLAGTLRAFTAAAFDIHHGLQAYDPTTLADDDFDTISGTSNAGCVQFISAAGRDRGRVLGPHGCSGDDPDRDGICHELTEGDLDMAEWYMLNHPQPARGRVTEAARRGEALFAKIGCTACHVSDWNIPAADPGAKDYTRRHAGDRRLFNVEVAFQPERRRLEGKLEWLTATGKPSERAIPRGGSFVVRGLYSDLRYHDVGEKFHQVQFDGTVIKQFRTAPLWGVGSTAPYGHDGASLELDDVIVRHGGEAQESRDRYLTLNDQEQSELQEFLRSLVLFQTDQLPCDLDGDGKISEDLVVAGQQVGLETLRPEWLLKTPCRIEGAVVNHLNQKLTSFAVTNVRESYGLGLPYLRDTDRDGWPDIRDPEPRRADFARGGRWDISKTENPQVRKE